MRNEASKNRSLKIAFVVNAERLRRLDTIIREASGAPDYTVGFSDGTNVHYNDVEEIVKQPNSDKRSIISLIAGTPETGEQTAFVTLRNADAESPSVEYTITGPQRTVVYLGTQLDDWIAATRQWYSVGSQFPRLGPILAIFLLIVPFLAWSFIFQFFFPESVRMGKTWSWVRPTFIVFLYAFEFACFKLFPRGTFAIGRGTERHEFLLWIRRGVLATLVVSVIASVIANLMTRHL